MELILIILPVILCIAASVNVNSTYSKYSKMRNTRGLTGEQVARQILDSNGLFYVRVEHVSGKLSDHFDPRSNVVRLSDSVFAETSVAALGVAAHECGHAIQHAQEYGPVKMRTALVPFTNLCSHAWYIVFMLGLFFAETALGNSLIWIGVLLFAMVAVFQLVTLPVEFDASNRAMKILEGDGFLYGDEVSAASKVLKAAALTYVASLLNSLMQLLRLLMIANRKR